jgi:type IV pilus assembly protein PilN
VILINLLPHREERRKRRKAAFFAGLGVSAAIGLVVVGLWYSVLQELTATQRSRNQFLHSEIAKLELQIKDIQNLKAEIEGLKARQKAVEDLQTDRNTPVYLLNELVAQTPEGVYLTSIRQDGQLVTINGVAQTNERVSEFLRNTAYSSKWLEHPELVEIKAADVRAAGHDQQRLYDFSMRVSLKRPQAASPSASAASGAASAPGRAS